MNNFTVEGNIADLFRETFCYGRLHVKAGSINKVEILDEKIKPGADFIIPGFIDSHVHIESSMLVPAEFARLAVVHGTVATVSDPHEIANVCGKAGVHYMIENGRQVNFKFNFGAPGCVPATSFETAGATLDSDDVAYLLGNPEIRYLSEMMNFPGVINGDADILRKIEAAKHVSKPIDGHAPGLRGEALATYIAAGISTDHECFTKEEALEKLSLGMKILVREGSAAKNFDALIELLADYPQEMMFCTDDMHPDNLVKGHINLHCKRAVARGVPVFNVLKAACFNPILHYQLNVGCLLEKDPADFIIVKDVSDFEVLSTYINGECVAKNGKSFISRFSNPLINKFNCAEISADSLKCDASSVLIDGKLPVIEAVDGQLVTNRLMIESKVSKGFVESDTDSDVLKLVVINRYSPSPPAIAFIKNFGLKNGAIASSVAHDSHNIIATGVDDEQIADAINLIVKHKGGISATDGLNKSVLPLPVAGLMSVDDGYEVADAYTRIDQLAKGFGSQLSSPFMTLSFMALLVIPSLKLSDLGLFDGQNFRFVYR